MVRFGPRASEQNHVCWWLSWSLVCIAFGLAFTTGFGQVSEVEIPLPDGAIARFGRGYVKGNIALSPDGRYLAILTSLGIELRDTKDWSPVKFFAEKADVIFFSPDAKILVSYLREDGIIKLWEVKKGQVSLSFTGVDLLTFSPDGGVLAVVMRDEIKLWNIETKQEVCTFTKLTSRVRSIDFSPSGKIFAAGFEDGKVKLWEVETGQEIRVLEGHREAVLGLAFSQDEKLFASASMREIKLWELDTGRELATFRERTKEVSDEEKVHNESVTFFLIGFLPDDEKTLVWVEYRHLFFFTLRTIILWDLETAQIRSYTLSDFEFESCSLKVSWDRRTLVVVRGERWRNDGFRYVEIELLRLQTREVVFRKSFWGRFADVDVSRDGRIIAISEDNKLRVWEVETHNLLFSLVSDETEVDYVTFSPNGEVLVSGWGSTIKLWKVGTWQLIRTISVDAGPIQLATYSPDGKILALVAGDEIKLWNVEVDQEIFTLKGHEYSINAVAFSPDGKLLASGSWDGIKLWSVETGAEICTLTGPTNDVWSVTFSPDGRVLAAGASDAIVLWEAGWRFRSFAGHTDSVSSVAFSPDGAFLASGSWDGTIKLWDMSTGREIFTFIGHKGPVNSIAFSPDGKILASGSRDATIKLWDVTTGQEIHTFTGHMGSVESVAFSPDGRILASGSKDGTVLVWDVQTILFKR